MSDFHNPTPNELFDAANQFVDFIKDNNIKSVIAVARGGVLIGELIARRASIPCYHIKYSSKHGKGDDKNHDNQNIFVKDVQYPCLIFDEISDSNLTLKELAQQYEKLNLPFFTGVLYHKQHNPVVHTPDVFWRTLTPDSPWVNFPWE